MTTKLTKLTKPAACPAKEWAKHYTYTACRDWTCKDLETFINGPSGEPKTWAIEQLAFRRRYNLP